MITVPKIRCAIDGRMERWLDGQADKQKKGHIEVGAPLNNSVN